MTRIIGIIMVLLPIAWTKVHAQEQEDHHGHEHHHEHHNEIGIANAPVYFVKEKIISYGLHLHYVRNLQHSRFGYGLGYERIFDDHGHNTYSAVVSYRVNAISFILAPGVTVEDEHPGEAAFAVHAEATYEFQLGDLHLGPVLEFAYDPEDIHISLGLHVGIGF